MKLCSKFRYSFLSRRIQKNIAKRMITTTTNGVNSLTLTHGGVKVSGDVLSGITINTKTDFDLDIYKNIILDSLEHIRMQRMG